MGGAPALCDRLSLLGAVVISDWSLRIKNCLLACSYCNYKDQGYFLSHQRLGQCFLYRILNLGSQV